MKRDPSTLVIAVILAVCASTLHGADPVQDVLRQLNRTASVVGTKDSKSYPVVFAAYLRLTAPPEPVTAAFNTLTIHPGMSRWSEAAGWAESNPAMAKAIRTCEEKTLFGLPYGRADVEPEFQDADLMAEIGSGGSLRNNRFPYLDAIDVITAFATAETYRLLEAGRMEDALDLYLANIFLLRQCCDREFLDEQLYGISLLIESLENLRDMMWKYRERIDAESFGVIAIRKLPFLRPDRSRLLLPEGDRVVSEALIKEVFDSGGQADREKFAATFASIQSNDSPLTRFGAARRWRMIAEVHDSKESSVERLELVYDDWWRRWRVEEYDPILEFGTQFERTNPVRFAAVIYSTQDVEKLFAVRNELIAHVYGTAMVAGLCGYHRTFGTYPKTTDMMYAQVVRKRSDRDPFDTGFAPFKYRVLRDRLAIDTLSGRVFVDSGQCILYSKGRDNEDGRGRVHRDDGASGDIVMWPPMKVLLREAGLLD